MEKDNLVRKIALYTGILTILNSVVFVNLPDSYHVQSRRNRFNATMLVDENKDSIPDYAMDFGFAGPTPSIGNYHCKRKPTKNEIELFKQGEFQDFGYVKKDTIYNYKLHNLENIVH